jgi:Tfp pilus assembly protein PilV
MGLWDISRRRQQQGFTMAELLLVVVFVVGLLVVAYSAARGIRSETAASDCQTQLRTLKMAAAEYQARREVFPPDKRTLVAAELVDAAEVSLWDLSWSEGDAAPTYRAVGSACS